MEIKTLCRRKSPCAKRTSQTSEFIIRYSASLLAWFFLFSTFLSAQGFEILYSDFDEATSLSVTQNSIYVVEKGNNRLLKLNHDGLLLESIGGNGSGDYNFSNPIDVDATNGLKIFVSDNNNRRIQVFDRRGQYLSSITARQNFARRQNFSPTYLTVDRRRDIIFYDERSNSIVRFNEDADLIDEFRLPGEIRQVDELIAVEQLLYILDKKAGLIHLLSENGRYESFYPAKNVQAFYTDGEVMWKCFSNRIVIEDRSAESETVELLEKIEAVDVQVSDGTIYLLTKNKLLKYN